MEEKWYHVSWAMAYACEARVKATSEEEAIQKAKNRECSDITREPIEDSDIDSSFEAYEDD